MPDPTLQFDQVDWRFGAETVLSAISLSVEAGQTLALVGPSGCGKTTLLRVAGGLLEPDTGRVARPGRIGFMFQEPRLLPWQRVGHNLVLGLKAAGIARSERRRRAPELADQVGLELDALDKYPHQLSGGMRQRVALARALAVEPELLLLDEPFSALDIGVRRVLIKRLIAEAEARRMAMLLVTHDLREALRISHQVLVMADHPGRIVHRARLDLRPIERDGLWVETRLQALLAEPAVASAFDLEAA